MAAVKFKVGDKVKIKKNLHGHGFEIGEKVIITKVNTGDYRADNADDYWYVEDEELYAKKYN